MTFESEVRYKITAKSQSIIDFNLSDPAELLTLPEIISGWQLDLDTLIHEPKRLIILLYLQYHHIITFSCLKKLLNTSSGNLHFHLKSLAENNLLTITKSFLKYKLCTSLEITNYGSTRLRRYLTVFSDLHQLMKTPEYSTMSF